MRTRTRINAYALHRSARARTLLPPSPLLFPYIPLQIMPHQPSQIWYLKPRISEASFRVGKLCSCRYETSQREGWPVVFRRDVRTCRDEKGSKKFWEKESKKEGRKGRKGRRKRKETRKEETGDRVERKKEATEEGGTRRKERGKKRKRSRKRKNRK